MSPRKPSDTLEEFSHLFQRNPSRYSVGNVTKYYHSNRWYKLLPLPYKGLNQLIDQYLNPWYEYVTRGKPGCVMWSAATFVDWVYSENLAIFRQLCTPDNCYFCKGEPKTSPQQWVRPYAIKMLETRGLCSRDIWESVLSRSAKWPRTVH